MTAPTATTPRCWCGHEIEPAGGPSWRHVGRIRDIRIHPAEPDQRTREQARLLVAATH